MKQNHSPQLLLIMANLLVMSACTKTPINGNENSSPEDKPAVEVTITTGSQTLSSDGGNATIAFKTTTSWNATTNVDWIAIEQTSGGAGNNTIRISVKSNEEYDQREGLVVISSGDIAKSVSVTQKQKDALLLTSNSIILDDAGGTPSIEVKANIDYSCKVEDNAKDWISIVSTRALSTYNITLSISENTSSSDRQGNVIVYSGNKSEVVTVYQKAKASGSGGSTTSLEGTSWYFVESDHHTGSNTHGAYAYVDNVTVIFSFRANDGTFIYSESTQSGTEYLTGTYSKIANDNRNRYSLNVKINGTEYNYTAEIIDNVLYIFSGSSIKWRLFKV